jgi:hypothetical protein
MGFSIVPPRGDSMTGSQFAATIARLDNGPREEAIFAQYALGNIPDFMRTPIVIELHAEGHAAVFKVLPDYLCVGTNDDFLRTPMNPMTAQRVADLFGAVLPTRKLVDAIWRYAPVKLQPITMSPSSAMTSTRVFVEHNARIEKARAGRLLGALTAGTKKDVVVTPLLALRPDRVAIYGWHRLDGEPIQRLNVTSHSNVYADYSHGVRLIDEHVEIDGTGMRWGDVLRDQKLSRIVSDEGPSSLARQPSVR